jgi:ABC-type transport system involved in multi-copper enzyme maturation permease subunit
MFNIIINTFKEIVRNKFLYLIVFFAVVFIAFSMLLWKLTIWDDHKIIVDFWLSMIEIFWLIWILFVWSQLLFKEIEWKTIFLILSKPINRYEFILWKFFWFSATIFLIVAIQAILFLFVLYFKDVEITKLILWSILFTFLKLEILLSLVFFFSTFMSNIFTVVVSIMVYFVAHSFDLLLDLSSSLKIASLNYFTKWLQLFFPPFEALNIKDVIGWFTDFKINYFLFNTAYSLVYLALVLFFSILIFNRKKFEN